MGKTLKNLHFYLFSPKVLNSLFFTNNIEKDEKCVSQLLDVIKQATFESDFQFSFSLKIIYCFLAYH